MNTANKQHVIPVILAGGYGSRLWPLSRELYPKQFLDLYGDQSTFQSTIARLSDLSLAMPIIVCNSEHRFLVAEQCRTQQIKPNTIIIEPVARNTAPAVALAALHAIEQTEADPLLLVLPSDHHIAQQHVFQQMVLAAIVAAEQDHLVTFGIVPQSPETGYGYIQAGAALPTQSDALLFQVQQFVEKPDRQTAESYLNSGNYYWNSGMFLFKASVYLAELKKYHEAIYTACQQALASKRETSDFLYVNEEVFTNCPENSIDYAVMEKTQQAVVLPLDVGWSDLGSWASLYDVSEKDESQNCLQGDVIVHDTQNSYIHATDSLVATIGVDNLAIIETADAVLVAAKNRVQEVKQIVSTIKRNKRKEHQTHVKVYRPWGSYECLDCGENFQVKRITVNPGCSLSLQLHHHRAEHWIVVRGTALVQKGDTELLLEKNQSTYIPLGVKHRLTNPGKISIELIEVQSGDYLGEDDIVRFEDKYGR